MATAHALGGTQGDIRDQGALEPEQERNIHAAEAELAEVNERARQLLRKQHPALFDRRGRLRKRALRHFLMQRAGGKAQLTKNDVIALAGGPSPAADAAQ